MSDARAPREARIHDRLKADRGQDTIEWVLIALLLSVATATVVLVLGQDIARGYAHVKECVSMAAGAERGPPAEHPDGGRGAPACRF